MPEYHQSSAKCRRTAPAGSVMILVLLAVAVASVLGMSFLVTSATSTAVTEHVQDQAKARQIAESGIAIAMAYIEQTPTWSEDRSNGTWVASQELYGGTFSLSGVFTGSGPTAIPDLVDGSFEQQAGSLPTPLLVPPMSGSIGGWLVQRKALLESITGLTVPLIGVKSSSLATDGNHLGYVSFPITVIGSASFEQTLASSLEANTDYALKVDVIDLHVASVLPDLDFRVFAGATLIASSSTSGLLKVLDLNADTRQYTVRFTTGSTPPSGPIRIELRAESLVGLLSGVGFDRVRLEIESHDPVVLTVVGRFNGAIHTATAAVLPPYGTGPARIIQWSEP